MPHTADQDALNVATFTDMDSIAPGDSGTSRIVTPDSSEDLKSANVFSAHDFSDPTEQWHLLPESAQGDGQDYWTESKWTFIDEEELDLK